ncbi:hypothetical protein CO046_01010 [Candidatus Peregrinibacteria bacterium CG_4_9_14_0_2_um_filter_53_11]|nr:MAG: hypothetical protein CO046_01010 [Candidatus Peregrinibacteria bacterium CG_4_9_14_0_2_um_filter_53_11]
MSTKRTTEHLWSQPLAYEHEQGTLSFAALVDGFTGRNEPNATPLKKDLAVAWTLLESLVVQSTGGDADKMRLNPHVLEMIERGMESATSKMAEGPEGMRDAQSDIETLAAELAHIFSTSSNGLALQTSDEVRRAAIAELPDLTPHATPVEQVLTVTVNDFLTYQIHESHKEGTPVPAVGNIWARLAGSLRGKGMDLSTFSMTLRERDILTGLVNDAARQAPGSEWHNAITQRAETYLQDLYDLYIENLPNMTDEAELEPEDLTEEAYLEVDDEDIVESYSAHKPEPRAPEVVFDEAAHAGSENFYSHPARSIQPLAPDLPFDEASAPRGIKSPTLNFGAYLEVEKAKLESPMKLAWEYAALVLAAVELDPASVELSDAQWADLYPQVEILAQKGVDPVAASQQIIQIASST